MSLFDTDVLIWLQRGNARALRSVSETQHKCISIQTYMELLQGANNKEQQKCVRSFVHDLDFHLLPFTENIGHRAAIYIEDYSLSAGLLAGDAIIAATAIENNLSLITGNKKHFRVIPGLELNIFTP